MTATSFNLIFQGQLEPGYDREDVTRFLERLFQFDSSDPAELFSGRPIVLGEGMDPATAASFQQLLAGAGVVTVLESADGADAGDVAGERRGTQRRVQLTRRSRVRSEAILPDRRKRGNRRG